MKISTDRILTTHSGSLMRTKDVLDLTNARARGQPYNREDLDAAIRNGVAEVIRLQAENGVDVVCDGEMSKPSFSGYIRQRLDGFELAPAGTGGGGGGGGSAERRMFREYYDYYDSFRESRGYIQWNEGTLVCRGPIRYKPEAVKTDIDNLKVALQGVKYEEAFMPATSPTGGAPRNEYYKTEEEYRQAYSDALHAEYRAIVDAGFLLQIDAPGFATQWGSDPSRSPEERKRNGEQFVERLNFALRDIPADRIRFHTCYSTNVGPRLHDAPLRDIAETMFKINAQAFSFEASNQRHFHDYHALEDVKLPEGKVLIPGMISHTTNIVEHPEFIAELTVNYAKLVGRENVIIGNDCGFSSIAMYTPENHPTVVWAKFRALKEGADLATKQLWGR